MATCPKCRVRHDAQVRFCPGDGSELLPDEAFASADPRLEAGAVLGEYEVVEAMAEGGFGTVYRCVHPLIGKDVAIKVLKREYSSNPEIVARFIAEARAVNQIRHRNIVDIFAFGVVPDGRHFFVMELLEGMTLDQLISKRGCLSPLEALPIIRQLGRALGAAHASGITHRDIKPENVFLVFDDDGHAEPKLLDFGIAKLVDNKNAPHVTRPGAPMGTPLYMSPEQVFARGVDSRSDIYSFGILIHEMLTGKPPFDGDTIMDVLTAQTSQPAPSMSSSRVGIPAELDAPVLAMLEKDPDLRPSSVTLAVERFFEAAEEAGITPRVSTPSGRQPVMRAITPVSGLNKARSSIPHSHSVATTLPQVQAPPSVSRRRMGWVAGAAVGGIVATLAVVSLRAPTKAEEAVSGSDSASPSGGLLASPTNGVALAASLDVAESAQPASSGAASAGVTPAVKVVLQGAPADAEVWMDGKLQGPVSAPLMLPRGSDARKLLVKRAGYLPLEISVVPDQDRAVPAALSRPRAVAKQPGPSDLEF